MGTSTATAPAAEQSAPVATLVLINGGSSTVKKVPGRKARYDFVLKPGAGIMGRSAHVREYTSLEKFHEEQADIAQSPVRMQVLVRLHEIDPVRGAQSAIKALTGHLANPKTKLAVIGELVTRLQAEEKRLREVSKTKEPSEPAEATGVDGEAKPANTEPPSARERRASELRRSGEEFVRHLVKDEYQIPDVAVLNNFDGMVAAVLEFEAARGDFDAKPPAASKPRESDPAAAGAGSQITPVVPAVTTALGTYSAESLAQMPIDDLKALAARLECRSGNRRTMVKDILERSKK